MLGVLEALLDLDALVRFEGSPEDGHGPARLEEGLVAAAVAVVNILADRLPLVDAEDLLAENPVGVHQTVEVEPGQGQVSPSMAPSSTAEGTSY